MGFGVDNKGPSLRRIVRRTFFFLACNAAKKKKRRRWVYFPMINPCFLKFLSNPPLLSFYPSNKSSNLVTKTSLSTSSENCSWSLYSPSSSCSSNRLIWSLVHPNTSLFQSGRVTFSLLSLNACFDNPKPPTYSCQTNKTSFQNSLCIVHICWNLKGLGQYL